MPKYIDACRDKAWHLRTWKVGPKAPGPFQAGQGGGSVVPGSTRCFLYRCGSWRHAGPCRQKASSEMRARITSALKEHRPADVLLLVFTLKPSDWADRYEAFKELREGWEKLDRTIARLYGKSRYVSTVEIQRNGWPHLNVILACSAMADDVRNNPAGALRWLKVAAVRAGFGHQAFQELAKDGGAVASYVCKVAGEMESAAVVDGRLVGEVVKLSQIPEHAPRHFRRIRSSKGFLPPSPAVARAAAKEVARAAGLEVTTGELVQAPLPVGPQVHAEELQAQALARAAGVSWIEQLWREKGGANGKGQVVSQGQRQDRWSAQDEARGEAREDREAVRSEVLAV